jgi:uncharacterized protein
MLSIVTGSLQGRSWQAVLLSIRFPSVLMFTTNRSRINSPALLAVASFGFLGVLTPARAADKTPQELQIAADSGDVEAQVLIGKAYWDGKQVPRDRKKAVEYYRMAAEKGHANAMAGLGAAYALGQGVEKDDALAADYFRKSANGGSPIGQMNLGNILMAGQGVEKNVDEGLRWLTNSAEQGFLKAQIHLAQLYVTGDSGVPRDNNEAIKWVRKAVGQDDPSALNLYGVMLRDGLGTKRDPAAAVPLFERAADKGILKAYLNLGNAYFFGQGVEVDPVKAMTWWFTGEMLGETNCGVAAAQFTAGIDAEEIKKARKLAEEMARLRRPALLMSRNGN